MHRQWYSDCKDVLHDSDLHTVNEAVAAVARAGPKTPQELVDATFEYLWSTYLAPVFPEGGEQYHSASTAAPSSTATPRTVGEQPLPLVGVLSSEARRVRAFKRWACDQLVFCYRFGAIYPKVTLLWKPLLFQRLRAGDVDGFRAMYDAMLQVRDSFV